MPQPTGVLAEKERVGKRKVLVGGGGVGSQEGHRFNKSDCRAQKVEYKIERKGKDS
jgi:hypothetical protein